MRDKASILVIDDSVHTRTFLHDFLEDEGYEVATAVKGLEGIEKMKRGAFNVVMLDIKLPDIDGVKLIKKIKKFCEDVCVIMITAYPDLETALEAIRKGAYDYIPKPFNMDEIKATIKRGLEKQRLAIENRGLLEELKRINQQLIEEKNLKLSSLHELGKVMSSIFNMNALFKLVLDMIAKIMKVQSSSLLLLDRKENVLTIKAALGLSEEAVKNTRVKVGEGVSGWVAKTGKPVLITDIDKDPRFKGKGSEKYLSKSLLTVPLKVRKRVVGVLNVNNKLSGDIFTEDDKELLSTLAYQTSVAIENALLCEIIKRAHEKIRQTQDQLVRSGRLAAVGELAASVAHEINTPLTTLEGFIHLLPSEFKDAEFREHFIKTAKREIGRLIRVTSRLLEFSRLTEAHAQPTDVNEIIEESLSLVEHKIVLQGITLNKRLATGLPRVNGDAGKLRQVFLNIISNALQAMPDGGELTVKTRKKRDGRSMEIEIADTGPGIPEDMLKSLFEPFFTTKNKGTGLGLSISKRIIDEHDGKIVAKSEAGKGATFIISLPVQGA